MFCLSMYYTMQIVLITIHCFSIDVNFVASHISYKKRLHDCQFVPFYMFLSLCIMQSETLINISYLIMFLYHLPCRHSVCERESERRRLSDDMITTMTYSRTNILFSQHNLYVVSCSSSRLVRRQDLSVVLSFPSSCYLIAL